MAAGSQIIIVTPNEGLARDLREALRAADIEFEPTVLPSYPTREEFRSLLTSRAGKLGAIIIDVGDQALALGLIREAKESHPDLAAVAADTASRADSILAAMRAGASEYLVPPFDVRQLRQSLQARPKVDRSSKTRGRLICFLPAQGGNGASTIALHVADAISLQIKKKVLLVDFDFHSGTIAFRLRLKPEFTLADALARTDVIDELWPRIVTTWNGLDVLPSPDFSHVSPDRLERIPQVFRSATYLYPCVIIDLPSGVFSSCQDVFRLADKIYLVSTPEVMSLHLARRKISQFMELGIAGEDVRLILNRVGSKKALDTSDVGKVVGVPVDWTISNEYSLVNDTYLKGELVPGNSALGRELHRLGCHVMGIKDASPTGGKKWKFL